MKLRLGETLIETDHIEMVKKVSPHSVKVFFISGNEIEVLCGIEGDSLSTWEQDANGFIQTIHNTDVLKLPERKNPKE